MLHTKIIHLSRRSKRAIMLAADLLMLPVVMLGAFLLRYGDLDINWVENSWLFGASVLVTIPVMVRLGLYRAVIRYIGPQMVLAVLKGITISTAVIVLAGYYYFGLGDISRSVFINFWLLGLVYIGGSRFLVRTYEHWLAQHFITRENVVIYGAGGSGVQLATALTNGREFLPVAFVDDNPAVQKSVIQGIRVYAPDKLPQLIQEEDISQILLAMPSISRAERRTVLARLEPLSVHVRTIPSMPEIVAGDAQLDQIREVEIDDLLGRDAVPPEQALLDACIAGKYVMVTGAGGSIGSELCRQILHQQPKTLVLYELSEFALYSIEKELRTTINDEKLKTKLIPLLGSVANVTRVDRVVESFGINTIYHAAAYKHVPMVEANILEGITNNILGTYSVAHAALKHNVDHCVLISTDKAVRPTNVMGATKRFAELVLQGFAEKSEHTCFSMVRFGNVLGSSGSVVPLFRKQIEQGGPVTVTHPDIIRYFMTIPEAAQLVIQAGSMATGGDVFVLDMGEPVKIVDLARKMIHLMGLEVRDENNPNGDILIEFTGLRPGEKLFEELLIGDNVSGTRHPKIMRAQEIKLTPTELESYLEQLQKAVDNLDCVTARNLLLAAVNGFSPSSGVVDELWRVTVKEKSIPKVASARRDVIKIAT